MANLTFVLDDGQEIVVPLTEHVTLGRGEDNDVVVDDDRVSKRHAELVHNADGSIQLFDSNSTTGTFVNGERVRSRTIRHGDRLAFGPLAAVLDLANHAANGSTPSASVGDKTQALTNGHPVKAEKIAARRRNKSRRPDPTPFSSAEPQEASSRLQMEKARLQSELESVQKELRHWKEQSAAEHAAHLARMGALRAEEERLIQIRPAVREAETAHGEWLSSIEALTAQHEKHTAALQLLIKDEEAARHELDVLATHRDQALAHLQQIRADSAHDQTVLDDLRRQITELQTRSQECKDIAEVREDQLKAAEKKLEQLSLHRAQMEAHILELSGSEEKLLQAQSRCHDAEAQHASLTAANAALALDQQRALATVKDLESRIATLQQSHQLAVTASAEALATRQRTEHSLQQCQADLATCEKDLASATQRLEQTQARCAELDQQCQALAETSQKLATTHSQLATAEQQLAKVKSACTAVEAQITEQRSLVRKLTDEESAAKDRIEALHARENDLHAELTELGSAEHDHRTRFEEVRQLSAEAEKEHAVQQELLASSLANARGELSELLSRLQPLRDWKEAMDLLYARLATLPQDSTAARDLWHEIEKEKAGLHELITTARTQAQAVRPAPTAPPAVFPENPPPVVKTSPPRRNRAGALPGPATAQETTLRSRLGHLRESVQREESRLEQLRRERMRHEAPLRASPAAEAMLREQARHLETRIRQDQERHHALQRSIEMSHAEEEKRRDRLGELEHKLIELRTSITEAERQRSELRQQADLAHAELKNFEAAIDRFAKKTSD